MYSGLFPISPTTLYSSLFPWSVHSLPPLFSSSEVGHRIDVKRSHNPPPLLPPSLLPPSLFLSPSFLPSLFPRLSLPLSSHFTCIDRSASVDWWRRGGAGGGWRLAEGVTLLENLAEYADDVFGGRRLRGHRVAVRRTLGQ